MGSILLSIRKVLNSSRALKSITWIPSRNPVLNIKTLKPNPVADAALLSVKTMTPQTLNALKSQQLPDANRLSYQPLPGTKKIYVHGLTRPDIRVPFREIALSDTKDHHGSLTP